MRKKTALLTLLLVLVLHHLSFARQDQDIIFKNGDRINFIGNSITHSGEFHNFIMLYYATRFPDSKVTFYNSGIWGDNANNFLRRMDEDILRKPADWSVVMAGMNDVNRGLYAPERQNEPDIEVKKQRAIDDYRGYLNQVIQRLLQANTRVILQKPSIYDQTGDLPAPNMYGVNDALQKCTVIIDELAQQYNLKVVDYFSILNNLNQQVQATNPKATLISNDRIHPGTPGNFIMAYQFLKDTGAPRFVSEISIRSGKLQRCKDCTVSNLVTGNDLIEFNHLAKSLPFPVPAEAASALELVPFQQELNAELLKVAALPKGDYALTIDGIFIRNYTSEELNKGVNLALEQNTPQYRQAVQVRAQTMRYRSLQRKLRDIKRLEINYLPASLKQAAFSEVKAHIDNLRTINDPVYAANKSLFDAYLLEKPQEQETEQQVAAVADHIYTINKPVTHAYRISLGAQTDPNENNTHSWEFEEPVVGNKVEGWTIVNYSNASTTDGILRLTGNMTYNHIRYDVPASNAIDPAQSKTAVIRLKNETGNGMARFYWWGSAATAAYIEFPVSANDTEFKEYKIDLSRDSRWSGSISIIRFDVPSPLHATSFGKNVQVDVIKLTTEVLPLPEPEPLEPMPAREPASFGVNLAGAEFGSNIPGVFGTDYTYPNAAELTYFKSKGLGLVRMPFKWERIQPELNGPLDPVELARMRTFLADARARGVWVLLDMHNYGRRRINGVEFIIGNPELPVATVADAWAKLANEFRNDENIWGYGIMNEPHGMLASTPWFNIAQAIITSIRSIDTQTTIVVGGDSWSSAARWPAASDNLKNLQDPSDNLIFEAHVYFDDDASGKYDQTYDGEQANPTIGIARTAPFVRWLRENGLRGFVGEYGVPDDDERWLVALDNMLAYLRDNCINGTYWAAGPWWNTYKLAVEPIGGVDRPQMAILEKYTAAKTQCTNEVEDNPETHIWDFNGAVQNNTIDGWTIVNYSQAASEAGLLNLVVNQTYQHIKYDVPASNVINPNLSKYAVIRLKNETPDTKARFYWWGPVGDNVANFVEFDISSNDTGVKEYTLDLSQNAAWTGKSSIRLIRFDVPAVASAAAQGKQVQVDQVKLLSALPQVFTYSWEFNEPVVNNKAEGWSIVNYTGAFTEEGVLNLTAAQTYNNIRYDVPAMSPIEPKVYKHLTIKLKNDTEETKARFYWWGPVGDNVANFLEFEISSNDTEFKEYTLDLSQIAAWSSKSYARIIRFDVPSPVQEASLGKAVGIDFIQLSSHQQLENPGSVTSNALYSTKHVLEKDQLHIKATTERAIHIAATVSADSKGTVIITDMLGRKLAELPYAFTEGTNALEVPVQRLSSGLYIATFYNANSKMSRKFIVQF
ncbi:cellulase family glycosylhydrolase [Pontibacter beigongshangensis]|uniref:cellulase family glycosylhydrolase n=1 Tax=Pontibacter beigongshangensis TaxID=2574733 RepID=UPI001650AF5D|nr:cellulase family glycosylhydrolase [Pontibacter beigongshangensis]